MDSWQTQPTLIASRMQFVFEKSRMQFLDNSFTWSVMCIATKFEVIRL
jgi:hypothetical protein